MGIQPILDFCKKFSKIICISIIILISLIILLIVLLLLFGGVKPIKDDYYQDIKTNFPIENKYRILGKYEVENQKYKRLKNKISDCSNGKWNRSSIQ